MTTASYSSGPNPWGCYDPQCGDSTWDHDCPVVPDQNPGRGPDGRSSIGPAPQVSAEQQIEAAAEAVAAALKFAATEPHGDLALSADRAALIAVRTLIVIGWQPA